MSRIIGINTLFLVPGKVGGTENYSRLLLHALEKNDIKNRYVIFCNRENYETFSFSNPGFIKVKCSVSATNRTARILYEQLVLPFVSHFFRCEILHSLGYIGPLFGFRKHVVTIHDANWKDHPEDVSYFSNIVQTILGYLVIKTAKIIVADSDFSRKRLYRYFPFAKQKIKTIEPWVSPEFVQLVADLNTRKDTTLVEPYALCVSGFYPHKRIQYLLSLFSNTELAEKFNLILVGRNGMDEQTIIQKLKAMPNVIYHPHVSDKELAKLYAQASLFLFPSVYEGFGYPVHEALAAGLQTYVGNKSMYSKRIQPFIQELTGDMQQDVKSLIKNGIKFNKSFEVYTADSSVKRLIRIYTTL